MEVGHGALKAEQSTAVDVSRLPPPSAGTSSSNGLTSNSLPPRASPPPTTTTTCNSSATQPQPAKAPDVKIKPEAATATATPTPVKDSVPRITGCPQTRKLPEPKQNTTVPSVTPRVTPNATTAFNPTVRCNSLDVKENEKHVRFGSERKNNAKPNNNTPAPTTEATTAADDGPKPLHRFVSPGRPMLESTSEPTTAATPAAADPVEPPVLEYKTYRSPARKAPEPDDEQLPSVASSPSCAQVSTSSSLASAVGETASAAEKSKAAPTASISVHHSHATDSPLGQASHADDQSDQRHHPLTQDSKPAAAHAKTTGAGNKKSGGLAPRPSTKESVSATSAAQHLSSYDVPFSPKSPIYSSSRGFCVGEEKKGGEEDLLSDSEIEKYSQQMDEFIPQTPKSRDLMSTPTDFAVDYGKASSGSSFDTSNVLAWLQSPTAHGLFSPGGGLGSILNTPAGVPRTPRTPIVSTSFFFSDVANLPKTDSSPTKEGAKKSKGGISSIICISPLASTRGRTGNSSVINTPLNFKDIFASPRERGSLPLLGDTPSRSSDRKPRKSGGDPNLDAVHMAERDLLEDDDLNVLLQLASNTPSSKHAGGMDGAVFRSPIKGDDGDNFPGLELPMIGNDAEGETAGKARLQKKPGSRNSLDSDTFGPPQLGLRTSSSHGSNKGKSKSSGSSKDEARDSNESTEAIKSTGSASLSNSNPYPMVPGYPGHPYYPMPGMSHIPPNATGSMRVVVGAPPPNRTGSKEPSSRPGGTPPPLPPYHEYPHPPGNMPYPPPPPGMFGSSYPSYNRVPSGARYPQYSHYPPPSQMPMYSAQHPPANAKEAPKRKNPKPVPKPPITAQAKRPAPPAPEPVATPVTSGVTSGVSTEPAPSPSKKLKKSPGGPPATAPKKKKSPTLTAKGDREKAAATIQAVNKNSGGNNDKAAALAAAILRGVTMRPSGKWQAQLYFAGKSRYIGVFDSREKAALAYEIAREKLKSGPQEGGALSAKSTENLVNEARKAAFDGVNERLPK